MQLALDFGDPPAEPSLAQRHLAELVEDAEWLARTGEVWENACRRLGRSEEALAKQLRAAGRTDLTRRLKFDNAREAPPMGRWADLRATA